MARTRLNVFAFIVILLAACNSNFAAPATHTGIVAATPTAGLQATNEPTFQPVPSSTPTLIAEVAHPSISANGTEVLVFTWDWPMTAGIPVIHIWKDGYALWVDYGEDKLYHVYESKLTYDELREVDQEISESQFWEYPGGDFKIPDPSWLTIRINQNGRQKSVAARDDRLTKTIRAIHDILDASPDKTEYFPKQGFLFTRAGESYLLDSSYRWPDDRIALDFAAANDGKLVDGDALALLWKVMQEQHFWIKSQATAYHYSLRITGLSCVNEYDRVNFEWKCSMFEPNSH